MPPLAAGVLIVRLRVRVPVPPHGALQVDHALQPLNRRFPGIVESVDLPAAYYDMAMAYNVAEHVPSGPPFFAAVRRALKPGGEFWLLTPHARHPFALLSNAVRLANVKKLFRGRIEGINEYPSYYRLNSARSIRRAVAAQSWSRLDIWYAPCAQWDRYFPRAMRAIPHAYDRLVGMRYGPAMLLLIARLTAEGDTR